MIERDFFLFCIPALVTAIDLLLRFSFVITYFNWSVPIKDFEVNIPISPAKLIPGKVIRYEDTKYLFDQETNNLWLQCTFVNRKSTFGLLKCYQVSQAGHQIERAQIRLSLGLPIAILSSVPVYLLVYDRFNLRLNDWERIIFPLLVIGISIYNYTKGYQRLQEESNLSIKQLSS